MECLSRDLEKSQNLQMRGQELQLSIQEKEQLINVKSSERRRNKKHHMFAKRKKDRKNRQRKLEEGKINCTKKEKNKIFMA